MISTILPKEPTDNQLKNLEDKLLIRLENQKKFISASIGLFKRLREVEPDAFSQAEVDWRWVINDMQLFDE